MESECSFSIQTNISDTVLMATCSHSRGRLFYEVRLRAPLEGGKQTTVDVETAYSHALRPYPAQITQAEKQFMEFTANAYFFSPYKTVSQTTVVNCASSTIESYSKVKPVAVSESTVTYGSYENKEPYSSVSE